MACPECKSYNIVKDEQYNNTQGNRVESYYCESCDAKWKIVLKLDYFRLIRRGNT